MVLWLLFLKIKWSTFNFTIRFVRRHAGFNGLYYLFKSVWFHPLEKLQKSFSKVLLEPRKSFLKAFSFFRIHKVFVKRLSKALLDSRRNFMQPQFGCMLLSSTWLTICFSETYTSATCYITPNNPLIYDSFQTILNRDLFLCKIS